jgi:hypothetical protein
MTHDAAIQKAIADIKDIALCLTDPREWARQNMGVGDPFLNAKVKDLEPLKKDKKMACECIKCSECGGTGYVWISFSGKYLGNHRCDDLDEMDTCESCGGDGLSDLCDGCREAIEKDEIEEENRCHNRRSND